MRWFGTPVPVELEHAANLTRKVRAAIEPQAYARSYNPSARSDRAFENRLQTLAVPALLVTGELDPNSAPAMSPEMALIAPHGERYMTSLTSPELVNEHVAALMRRDALR